MLVKFFEKLVLLKLLHQKFDGALRWSAITVDGDHLVQLINVKFELFHDLEAASDFVEVFLL